MILRLAPRPRPGAAPLPGACNSLGGVPIRDELIERTIQQLAALMAKLLLARSSTLEAARLDLGAAERELEGLYLANLGTSRSLVGRLGVEDLIGVLGTAGYVDGERAYLLGALLSVDAEVALVAGAAEDDAEVLRLRNAALAMLLEAGSVSLGEPDLDRRVQNLLSEVPEELRPDSTFERLFRYEFTSGRFARAEDALFAWLDRSERAEDRLEVAATAGAFYDALESKSAEELELGDFEQADVALGRADFAARFN